MTPDLDHLEQLAKAATQGPWSIHRGSVVCDIGGPLRIGGVIADINQPDHPGGKADAAYIAAVSPDVVLALIAELRALRVVVHDDPEIRRAIFRSVRLHTDKTDQLRAALNEALDALDMVWEGEGRAPMRASRVAELRKLVEP
jgi:hypothetical protein